MADKKILAEKHIDRIKNKFVDKVNISAGFVPPVSSENYQRFLQYKDTFRQTAGYKMKDLYPDTYQTMTSIPTDIDYSKLVRADGLFEGCAALQSVDGLDLSSAISASHLFEGCTSLTSVKGLNTPNVADFSFAFYDCENLSELEEFDTSKCHDFYEMFAGCTSLPEKFPWALNMMGLQKHREKLIFHCSSVKELDCYITYINNVSYDIIGDEILKSLIVRYMSGEVDLTLPSQELEFKKIEINDTPAALTSAYNNMLYVKNTTELIKLLINYTPDTDEVIVTSNTIYTDIEKLYSSSKTYSYAPAYSVTLKNGPQDLTSSTHIYKFKYADLQKYVHQTIFDEKKHNDNDIKIGIMGSMKPEVLSPIIIDNTSDNNCVECAAYTVVEETIEYFDTISNSSSSQTITIDGVNDTNGNDITVTYKLSSAQSNYGFKNRTVSRKNINKPNDIFNLNILGE